jgi:hypothetical protein
MRNALRVSAVGAVTALALAVGGAVPVMAATHPAAPQAKPAADVRPDETLEGGPYSWEVCGDIGWAGLTSGKWNFYRCSPVNVFGVTWYFLYIS